MIVGSLLTESRTSENAKTVFRMALEKQRPTMLLQLVLSHTRTHTTRRIIRTTNQTEWHGLEESGSKLDRQTTSLKDCMVHSKTD